MARVQSHVDEIAAHSTTKTCMHISPGQQPFMLLLLVAIPRAHRTLAVVNSVDSIIVLQLTSV